MTRTNNHFGWIPDLPDQRDQFFAAPPPPITGLPAHVDLRSHCPPIYDQGELGSCTANAIGAAIEFDLKKQNLTDFAPSRLFIYYNERAMEGTVDSDSGAQIRDGIKSVSKLGVCPESEWPYNISQFTEKPTAQCYTDGLKTKVVQYMRLIQNLNELKARLASGFPFVFGFTVYESFESQEVAHTGHVPMPAPSEKMLGGHAVMAVGYNDAHRQFIVRNSWGTGWGMHGYFTMPYEYLVQRSLASDFWMVKLVS